MRRPASAAGAAGWVLLAGSIVLVDPSGLLPATALRWAVVATAVLVLAGANAQRGSVPRHVALATVGLLVLVGASALDGVDPVRAWIGHPRRNLGALTWVVFAGAGLLGTVSGSRGPADGGVRAAARAAAVGALALTATVAGELAGLVPTGLGFDGPRAGGWYGQPVILGAAAVLLGFAALGTALDPVHDRRWRIAAATGVAGCAGALLASGTRGAWLGALAGGAVALPTLRRLPRLLRLHLGPARPGASARRSRTVAVAALAAAALVLLVSPVGTRVTSAFADGGTGQGRLDEWRIAADVVADHPLLGVGPEGYRMVAPSAIDADYAADYGRDVVVDRAHSGPLDVAIASGIPAATIYVALVAFTLLAAWRLNRRAPMTFTAGAGAGIAAFAVAQLTAFPTAEVDPLAWFLGGMVVAVEHTSREPHRDPAATRAPLRLAMVAIAAVAVWAGTTGVLVDHALGRAVRAAEAGDLATAVAEADDATELRPDHPDAWYVAARLAARGPSLLDLDAGLERVEAGRDHVPGDPALEQLRVELLAARALRSGLPADRSAAMQALRGRLAQDPTQPVVRELLAEVAATDAAGSDQ